MKIIFLGTPDFAVASLKILIENGYNIIAVITAPDKPSGRGMQLQQSAVKQYALEQNIKVLQPEKLKNIEFLEELKMLNADLQIVVAFRMLPQQVWEMPPLGTINVHGSLLPNYRGAAPINWAIINGEKETGVTTFKLQHAIDTGNILLQKKLPILDSDTMGTMYDKMKEEGAILLLETLEKLQKNTLKEIPQLIENIMETNLKHAPKISTETCLINFNSTVEQVYNHVRGLSPIPCAFTFINEKKLKIYSCHKSFDNHSNAIGSFVTDNKTYLKFACINGFIMVNDIQLEGKKRMMIEDFLRGNKLN